MRQLEDALRRLSERAEPIPTEVLIARIETELGWASSAVAEREEPTMVTRQQPDLETPAPTRATPPRSRRGPLVAAAVAVVVILAGVGIAFASGAFDSESDPAAERLAVATQLLDDWNDGWNTNDPEAVAAVFTEDGTFIAPDGVSASGHDELMLNCELTCPGVTDAERTGELTATGDGTFTARHTFVSLGITWAVIWEIELDGDLASRIEAVEASRAN
jgi:hypothetical protein